jgi:polysaccharide export outer membrane protein
MGKILKVLLLGAFSVGLAISTLGLTPLRAQEADAWNPQDSSTAQTAEPESGGAQVEASTLPSDVTNPDYVIGPEDVLTIDVFNLPEMKQTVRVENDGTIAVRLLGPVRAAGLTPIQLKHELETDWGKKYLQDPQVSIFIKKFHAHPVSVVGSVEKPGLYQLPGSRSLVQVLAMAGGLVRSSQAGPGAGRYLYITRPSGFDNLEPMDGAELVAPNKLKVNIKKLLFNNGDGPNVMIRPKDQIIVPRAGVVYVVGDGVMHPQKIILEDQDNITVLEALAEAAGLAPLASKNKARIIHRSEGGAVHERIVNIGNILKGKAPDPSLSSNDVLFVPRSLGRSTESSTAATAIGVLSGWVIWHGI